MSGLGEWDRCARYKMKNDRMVGADDGSTNTLWWLTKTMNTILLSHPINHPNNGQVD
jgi:hypothetical protein